MKMNGARILCESLVAEGVDTMFGIIGAATLVFYDTLPEYPELRHVTVRHEQGAAHAADGYARRLGKVGVCIATSGPGATNMVTGIANACLDSVPLVAITGQVARPFRGKDAFQEIDITAITAGITKRNYYVEDAASLAAVVREAFHIARSGRPGPVLIDIPRDVFTEEAEYIPAESPEHVEAAVTGSEDITALDAAATLINRARQPLIIAGHGIRLAGACGELRALAEAGNIPVASTLLGVSAFPGDHTLNCGLMGMHGLATANRAVSQADVIIAAGARLNDRVTADTGGFAPGAAIIHIDIDASEIGKNIPAELPLRGDVRRILPELRQRITNVDRGEWLAAIDGWRCGTRAADYAPEEPPSPQLIMRTLSGMTGGAATIVTGVGQHQMWAAQHYCCRETDTFISSGGLGTMGFALPAAIGARLASPQGEVWAIDGDGSLQMTIQELAVLSSEKLDLKIAVINNGGFGMVRQWQGLFYAERYVETDITGPDFTAVAAAYGIPARRVTRNEDIAAAIAEARACPGPFLVDFAVAAEQNVYPMVPPGAALSQFIESPDTEAVLK